MPQSGRSLKPACGREWYSGWRRISVVPQLDGRPLWEPPATPLFASHGTREDHRTRRLRSSPRTSGPFESVFRWRTGCGSSPVSTWASATSFAGWPGCGQVRDVCHRDQVASRAVVMQHKTQRPVQFEITPAARDAAAQWIRTAALKSDDYLFPSRIHGSPHLGTRQYARVRHPIYAANKSDADLSANKEPSRNSAASR